MNGGGRYWCELAWLGDDRLATGVTIDVTDGRIESVVANVAAPAGAERLQGITLPGMANVHSHAFHRALRGRTHAGRGTFWTWRQAMYDLADRLDPESYLDLATAVYAEMALAGITAVGEFHYLHHAPGGTRYADPNAMGTALVAAAAAAGVRLTLLDTCYLAGGLGTDGHAVPLAGTQLRFGDGSVSGWAGRVAAFRPGGPDVRLGAAIHSVRAVPADAMGTVAETGARLGVLHAHVSEQPAENEACLAVHGRTPTGLLADNGALGPHATLVHATHLTHTDRALIADTGSGVCLCPTTERDLADGIGPAAALRDVSLSLGSDSHAVVDLFGEARAVELDERLASQVRGHFTAAELLTAATTAGHAAIGWPDAGRIAPGQRADLVTVGTHNVRLAGAATATDGLAAVAFAATAADVSHVLSGGCPIVREGRHVRVGDVPAALTRTIEKVLP